MQPITKVVFPQLFWDTLEQHRTHPRYSDFRASIRECILRKVSNRSFISNSDEPFSSSSALKGTWHNKISRNPDVVLFYRMQGDTFHCSMIGDHSDYKLNGKGAVAEKATARKIHDALFAPHMAFPGWKHFRWNTPKDLLKSVDLHEGSTKVLDVLLTELKDENMSLNKLTWTFNSDINDLPEDIVYSWMDDIEKASFRIQDILTFRISALSHDKEYTPVNRALCLS